MTFVTPAEFKSRRQKLFKYLGNKSAIINGSIEFIRNGDVHFPFRQNSDFYYLTGFNEPNAIAVFHDGEFILYNRPRNPEREIWEGPREGQEGAVKNYGADKAYPIDNFISSHFNVKDYKKTVDIEAFLAEERLIKSADEIKTMRKANEISINAHIKTMQHAKHSQHEYELQAAFTGECLKQGSFAMAYPAIVGAGKNSCTLHYSANNQKMNSDDIILIDAGCEFENYASDITRCYPSKGKFNPQQKAVYEIVYEAQRAAIESIKPGLMWTAPQDIIVKIMTQGLIDLKLLTGNIDDLIQQKAYMRYYMHSSGHWLGLDVHDVGKREKLQPGNALTVEPGLYIPEWNIGIRIEDDIVVTESGYENLTEKLPRKLSDIENLMSTHD
ncbi:MAG TPA: aminopeptidase P N-terminal domain-containing protein [Gammaproteobacteria bacterium]|nr:aminopeptidase P N-terminal domain-containing protein [Gammaproteobacteria bacterium]